jgi:hypothetical protein
MSLRPFSVGSDNNGAVSYTLLPDSDSNNYTVTTTDEQVLAIPTTNGKATAVLITPGSGVDMWFTCNTSSAATSIVSSGVGTQALVTGRTFFQLSEGSTHIHYKVTAQPAIVSFQWYGFPTT